MNVARWLRLAPLLLLLMLLCTSCGTLAGMTVGGLLDKHNMEERVLADSVSVIPVGTKLIVRTRSRETVRGMLAEVVRENGTPTAVKLTMGASGAARQAIADTASPTETRTIALSDIESLRTRKPGIGSKWLFVLVGATLDVLILHAFLTLDWT